MAGRIGSTVVMPTPRPSPPITRRAFVVGAGAAGALLAAGCGSSTTTTAPSSSSPDTLNLALRFDPNTYALAGVPLRLVVSVLTNRGEPPATMADTLQFQ